MSFELFRFKGGKGRFGFPTVTMQASGGMGLNDKAYELLGSPKAVQLYYERESRKIGIKATDEHDRYGFPVRQSGETSMTVTARSFCMYYGINVDVTAKFRADVEDDMLVFALGAEPVARRKPRRRALATENAHGQERDERAVGLARSSKQKDA
jgi:hypothetical protein